MTHCKNTAVNLWEKDLPLPPQCGEGPAQSSTSENVKALTGVKSRSEMNPTMVSLRENKETTVWMDPQLKLFRS